MRAGNKKVESARREKRKIIDDVKEFKPLHYFDWLLLLILLILLIFNFKLVVVGRVRIPRIIGEVFLQPSLPFFSFFAFLRRRTDGLTDYLQIEDDTPEKV